MHPLRLMLLAAIVQAAATAQAQTPSLPPAGDAVTPQLFATGLAPAESLAFDRQGTAYLSNYRRPGAIGRILADGTASILCDLAEEAPLEGRLPRVTGLRVDVEARLIAADAAGGRLLRIAADGSRVEVLADRYEGERLGALGAVALDLLGNIYFTDRGPQSEQHAEGQPPTGALYRYEIQTHKVTLLDADLESPAGVAIAPDQERLCVAEGGRDQLLLYRLNRQGEVEQRRVLVAFVPAAADAAPGPVPEESPEDAAGGSSPGENDRENSAAAAGGRRGSQPGRLSPGGMVFDREGRLYVTLVGSGLVAVVDSDSGEVLSQYEAGGAEATDCHFHDGELFITIAAKEAVFRLPLSVEGFDYSGQ